jgi:hypothetical protein
MTRNTIRHFMCTLLKGPPIIKPGEEEQYRRPWGFTIYRTSYGPGSEEQWRKLLQKATDSAKCRLLGREDVEKYPDATTKALNLFSLDPRSDPERLEGLSLNDVRELYLDGSGGQPLNVDREQRRIFLLADDEVLQDPDLALLKVVAADFGPGDALPRHGRVGPRYYFGWITMPTTAIYDLWVKLTLYYMEEIISPPGGPGVYWDPLDY